MKPDLGVTSVPGWAVNPSSPAADVSGRSWTIISLDAQGSAVVSGWRRQIASAGGESAVRQHQVVDVGEAIAVLNADLADARVGWRLLMAGPAHACLGLRAEAMRLGVADDEMTVASTEVGARSVRCVHCRTVTHAQVNLEEVLPCAGCDRNLVVYYHVSRRQGAHLGFMVDAEAAPV